MPSQRRRTVPLSWIISLVVVPVAGLSGCTAPGGRPEAVPSSAARPLATSTAPAAVPLDLSIGPAPGTRDVAVTTEIALAVAGGTVASVSVTDPAGHPVAGALRADGTSWVPDRPLAYGRRYQATVTARAAGGATATRDTAFTTMADPGGARIGTGLYFFDGATYGVGMPVVVEFSAPIPAGSKAAVERRLFVTSEPPQAGVWHWYGDRQVLYRPRGYWRPGTTLTVRAALGGLPVGRRLLDTDRGGTASIGARQFFVVRDANKSLSVYRAGRLLRSFPVSLGKPSTPTSSGNLVIMSRDYSTLFKTPEYELTAYYDERLTWGGQYFHAAPWSTGQQGNTNVSHGCVNLSMDNARWVYENSQIGDPVTILGTPVHIGPGDGWTVWDMPWSEYLRGSALEHPELAGPSAGEGPEYAPGTIRVAL